MAQNKPNGFFDDMYTTLKGVALGTIGGDQLISISNRARRNISMYRVLISASIKNEDVAKNITKYIECMCSIFTMMATGYNPLAQTNRDINAIVDMVSAENFNMLRDSELKRSYEYALTTYDTASAGRRSYGRIGIGAFSTEANNNDNDKNSREISDNYNKAHGNKLFPHTVYSPKQNGTSEPTSFERSTLGNNHPDIVDYDYYTFLADSINDEARTYIDQMKKDPRLVKDIGVERPAGMSDSDWIGVVQAHLDLKYQKYLHSTDKERRDMLRDQNSRAFLERMEDRRRQLDEMDLDERERAARVRKDTEKIRDRIERNRVLLEDLKQQDEFNRRNESARFEDMKFITKLEDISSKATPTVVQMSIMTPNGKVVIPLAIKANAYGLREDEMRLMLECVVEGKVMPEIRKLKWKTGEITTLNYYFGTDIVEKEKRLYSSIGRHPWLINLMTRQAASRGNRILKSVLRAHGANDTKYERAYDTVRTEKFNLKGDIPPTSTIVASVDDLVAASGLDRRRFLNNDTFIRKIMKELFLLCFCVVDTITQECYFFFSGYSRPFVYSYDDLEKNSKDTTKLLAESVNRLSTKV